MSTLDLAAIASNLAGRFAAGVLTAPPGLETISLSTHLLPTAVTVTPTVLVSLPDGNFEADGGAIRGGEFDFPVDLYLAEGSDLPANTTKLYAWYGVLFDQLIGAYDLDLSPTVIDAFFTSSRMGKLTYAGRDYVGIRFVARVRIQTPYNATT